MGKKPKFSLRQRTYHSFMSQKNEDGLERGQFWKELNERWNAATNKEELDQQQLMLETRGGKKQEEELKNGEQCDELEEIVDKLQAEVDGLAALVQEKDNKKEESSDELNKLALEYSKYKDFKNKMLEELARVSDEIKNLKGAGGGPQ